MPTETMNYLNHLRQFFDEEVDDAELKALAVHAIATDVRRLKPAISQAIWDSRQQAVIGAASGSDRLNEARQLHSMYARALDEFRQITELTAPAEAVAGHGESTGRTENDSDSASEHR